MKTIIIGIAGASGSGKTTLAKELIDLVGVPSVIITLDEYYHDNKQISFEERTKINYDEPAAIDFELAKQQILALRDGKEVALPQYDFSMHTRKTDTVLVPPVQLVIVEGIFALDPELLACYDYTVFLETSIEKCCIRRMTRDIVERGRDPQSVCTQLINTVIPGYYTHVLSSKKYAHYIVNWDGQMHKEVQGLAMMAKGHIQHNGEH